MPYQDVARRYDSEAPAFRDAMAGMLIGPGRRLLEEFRGAPARRVLDVGTGVGVLLPEFRAMFPAAEVVGCDASPGMLRLCPAGSRVVVMDAGRLALATGSVDLVVAAFMLSFLDEPLGGLREMRRVLRAGGSAGTITWGSALTSPALDLWGACVRDCGGDELPEPDRPELDDPGELERLLLEAGFASARAWTEELRVPMQPEELIRLKTTIGQEKVRFDGLEAGRRDECLALVRARLAELTADELVARTLVVYGMARA